MTCFEEYCNLIETGEIIVGQDIKKTIKHIKKMLNNPNYIYDTSEAERRIFYIENCCFGDKKPYYMKPLVLMPWEKMILEVVYSFRYKDTGLKVIKEVLIVVGRKNGKTAFVAGDLAYDVRLGDGGQDVVAGSNDDKQASIVWKTAGKYLKFVEPKNKKNKIVHQNQVEIVNVRTSTTLFKMSSKMANLDGRNIDKAVLDEIHEAKDHELYNAITQSMGTKDDYLLFMITTAGTVREGLMDEREKYARSLLNEEEEDDSFISFFFTMDDQNEPFVNRDSWQKANPSLPYGVKKYDYIEKKIKQAKLDKAIKISVLCKDFNIKQDNIQQWLEYEDYNYEQVPFSLEEFRGSYCLGAVDLAFSFDLACAKVLLMRPNDPNKYIVTKYFIPEGKLLNANNDDLEAGAKYQEWVDNGLMETSEGNDNDLTKVADWFRWLNTEYEINVLKCGYDTRDAKTFLNRMYEHNIECERINQSKRDLTKGVKLAEADLKTKLIHGLNEVDKWCLSNSAIEVNKYEQCQVVKMGKQQKKKIDGAVTLTMLYKMYDLHKDEFLAQFENVS